MSSTVIGALREIAPPPPPPPAAAAAAVAAAWLAATKRQTDADVCAQILLRRRLAHVGDAENAGLENAGPNFQGGKRTTTVY